MGNVKLHINRLLCEKEIKEIRDISKRLGLPFCFHEMKKIEMNFVNAFEITKGLMFFYPVNDGMPTCHFEFFKDGRSIMTNQYEYTELSNLDEILLQMVTVFRYALINGIVLDPYCFMLKFDDEIKVNYHSKVSLVITEKAIVNPRLTDDNFKEATIYYINHFLDHFIGWNFGVPVNRSKVLKEELESLNSLVIDMGLRRDAGPGFEVYGTEDKVQHGLQHYKLPVEKSHTKKKNLFNKD